MLESIINLVVEQPASPTSPQTAMLQYCALRAGWAISLAG